MRKALFLMGHGMTGCCMPKIEPVVGSDVLSDDTCLSKERSMESLDAALAL